MIPSKKTLICCAMPFGYGPAAKLITIASLLRTNFDLTFIGHGIAYECVARSQHLFSQVILARATEPFVQSIINKSVGILSIEDREFASFANQLNKPLFVVDSLLWMRDCIPQELDSAKIYWAQNFSGLSEPITAFQPQAVIVGPITSLQKPYIVNNRTGLLVNLGGCESPDNGYIPYQIYAKFIIEGILKSRLLQQFPGKITVTGGYKCINVLRRLFSCSGIKFTSLSYEEAQAGMSQAALVLTAPGMTTLMECFEQQIPTFFLPPQNYSQWCTLRHLRLLGIAPYAFHWEDLLTTSIIKDRLPESQRKHLVSPIITSLTQDAKAKTKFQFCIQQIALISSFECQKLAQKQREFFSSLGVNGTRTIVNQLLKNYT